MSGMCIPMISISDSGDSDRASRAVYFLLLFLTRLIGLRQFTHRLAFEFNAVSVMQQPVH